jgi:hypothetical protein
MRDDLHGHRATAKRNFLPFELGVHGVREIDIECVETERVVEGAADLETDKAIQIPMGQLRFWITPGLVNGHAARSQDGSTRAPGFKS